MNDLSSQQRSELLIEIERWKTAHMNSDKSSEARDRANRHRIRSLEEQVSRLGGHMSKLYIIRNKF